ncbi:DUF3108 domain-containing protein [Roseomonas sp. OT10]|uniref:DUF3108 domain-containing protein n=1 Tax=Roseomonas cutis TaxID=2897332 RepID=UPI001E2B8041|nr:DUF3108 domain-containing protein [Roseomonas sp. OT10]UFN50445.1 DUF3108 domain-containing protein [Roseomonas sp. OT10]
MRVPSLLLALLLAPAAARAAPIEAVYAVQAAGVTVVEATVQFDFSTPDGYAIEVRHRTRGIASVFVSADMVSRTTGRWVDNRARPTRFSSEGTYRGEQRRTLLEYVNGQPAVRSLVPPNEGERESVAPELQRGTIDSLSGVAQLAQDIRRTGRCEGQARTFDGRRLTEFRVRTAGWEMIPPARDTWSGRALHCRFVGQLLAGFRFDDDASDRRPQEGDAWMAEVRPGEPPIPVRLEVPSKWFGSTVIILTRVGEPAATGTATR